MGNFEYTHRAIKTEYNGVIFRSRLEATWAAFFDLMGWNWEYEPIDLNGWSPDFLLSLEESCFVEVKPIASPSELTNIEKYIRRSENHCGGLVSNCLLLGVVGPTLMPPSEKYFYANSEIIRIGWIYNFYNSEWEDVAMKTHGVSNTAGYVCNLLGSRRESDWKGFLDRHDLSTVRGYWTAAQYAVSFLK